jgi:hypothetical protein
MLPMDVEYRVQKLRTEAEPTAVPKENGLEVLHEKGKKKKLYAKGPHVRVCEHKKI